MHGECLLYYGIDREKGSKLEKVDQWNSDNRFSRCYLDEDNDPILVSDLDFSAGVTLDAVREWVRKFAKATGEFSKSF